MVVTPASIAFNIAGGSTIQRHIVIDWDGGFITAGRLWTNVTPNSVGLNVTYNVPTWEHYFFLLPHHQNITMTISAHPALQPGNYTIMTTVEVFRETQILVTNNTVTVIDTSLQDRYAALEGNRNSLQENLSALFTRFTDMQSALNNQTLALEREKENSFRSFLIGAFVALVGSVLLISGIIYRYRRKRFPAEMTYPNGTIPLDETEQVNIVGRRQARWR